MSRSLSSEFIDSCVGDATYASARGSFASAGPASAARSLTTFPSRGCPSTLVSAAIADACATASPFHVVCCNQGPTGRSGTKGGVSSPTEDSCLRGGGRSKFSVGWLGTGAGC